MAGFDRASGADQALGFEEYAALARHLHELVRAGERTAAQTAARRNAIDAGIDQLGQRLVSQQQRLTGLAQMIGEPVPQLAASAPLPPLTAAGHLGPGTPTPPYPGADPELPAGSSYPELPAGSSYPELPAGRERRALPATPAADAGPRSAPPPAVPGQRQPMSGGAPAPPAATIGPTEPVDPAGELELARRAVDAADEAAAQVESLAQQPPLLPGSSPLARAVAVYAAFAGVGAVVQLMTAVAARFEVIEHFTWYAWSIAGLPAIAFFAGYIALGMWGKPRIVVGSAARYARLGFGLCFVGMTITSCAWSIYVIG
jgi:hypothetical protein